MICKKYQQNAIPQKDAETELLNLHLKVYLYSSCSIGLNSFMIYNDLLVWYLRHIRS